jgi:hypothetical protein
VNDNIPVAPRVFSSLPLKEHKMQNADFGHHAALRQHARSGANWFYWIAALSLITSVAGLLGSGWRFFLSLGSTQIIDGLASGAAQELGDATKVIAFVLDIFITGIFAGLAWFAGKKHLWAYIVGMVFFGLDGLLLFLFQDWISGIFHAVVLFWIFRGFQSARQLVVLEREAAQYPPPPETTTATAI